VNVNEAGKFNRFLMIGRRVRVQLGPYRQVTPNASTRPFMGRATLDTPLAVMQGVKSTEDFLEVVRKADLADLKSQRDIFST
jgi:hypothetical protein